MPELPTRYVVTYAPKASQQSSSGAADAQADQAAASVDAEATLVGRTVGDAAVITLDRQLDDDEKAAFEAELAAADGVLRVEEDHLRTIAQTDPLAGQQWHYSEPTGGIGLSTAHGTSTGAGATVAVIDTGIVSHPDLDAQVVGGYDFISDSFVSRDGGGRDADYADPGDWSAAGECGFLSSARDSSWHGSHVAGTGAAISGNGEGGLGVAPDADVVVARVLGRCGGYDSDIAAAITWAAGGSVSGVPANPNPADVLNLSLGGSGSCPATYQSAIDAARAAGATVVVAAGNSSTDASGATPANCDGVVTVAATNRDGGRASYANHGSVVELAAPGGGAGGGVLSTVDVGATSPAGPGYAQYNGTSMATPHVAGVAALLYADDPAITPAEVSDALVSSARAFPASCSGCGAGILDAPGALGLSGGGGDGGGDDGGSGDVVTFTGPLAIPDAGSVDAPLQVDRAGTAPADLEVSVDIAHTYRGDLRITLIAPGGASVELKAPSAGDSADDVVQTWTVDASSVAAAGTWTLRVADVYRQDTGTIASWSLGF
ncbi:S8 family serine peptidase [Euzebya sp.]|uniref:S8 family serine peptidase n=1 Tax=Euzebya sp. TaxID=1971409 RepID=UPI0035176F7A